MANIVDLFTYLPGLQVSDTELMEAELVSQQILQAQFPDMDLREGTAIRDLVIRPNATLLAMINKAILYYFSQNTLDQVTDETSPEFVDRMLSNWFLTRKPGSKSVINVKLAFARRKSVSLSPDSFFSVDGVYKFYPSQGMTIAPEELTYDAYNNEYYINVDLVAEQDGSLYNISSGSLLYFSTFDPYFLHGEIAYLKQAANNSESNTQFLTRAGSAISTRNLINIPSIASNVLENFPLVTGVKSVGYGDPEMLRDKVKVVTPMTEDPIWIHIGGKTDVYCRVALATSMVQLTTDATGKAILTGPIYKVDRSLVSAGNDNDTIPTGASYTITNQNVMSAPVTLTSTFRIVTATCINHGFTKDRLVTISGADQSEYNGSFRILSVTKDTFTYEMASDPVVDVATGTITAKHIVPEGDVGFSPRQALEIDFGISHANGTCSFEIYYFQGIDGIQDYLEDPENKVLCADLLARGFNLYLLDVSIVGYNGPAYNSDDAFKVVEAYLASLNPGEPFVMSDLLAKLYEADIKTIRTPLDITYTKYTRDLLPPTTGAILDTLDPEDATAIFLVNTVSTSSTTL